MPMQNSPSPLQGFATLPSFSPDGSFPPYSSFAPSPSPSISSFAQSPSPSIPDLSPALKRPEFGEDCGWSWNDAHNPKFKLFFDKYLPVAKIPDRRVLSGTILTGEANRSSPRRIRRSRAKWLLMWKMGGRNVAHTHVDTSVLCVEGQTHDMTGHPKTGNELFGIMKSDFKYAEETYGVEIIAVCTDDGPDGKKARRLIKAWKCSIAVFECWAHQSSLMTGNYLAIKAPWMKDAKDALEVVKWFNNHGKALDLLRAQQSNDFLPPFFAFFFPVVTRWTIHYCCLRRACVVTHEEVLRVCAGRKEEQIAAAESVIATCNRASFWINIGRIVKHLEPLAIAANILQAPDCRLDTRYFSNPYLRAHCFKRDVLPANKIFHLDAAGDIEFLNAFREYYDEAGDFSSDSMWLEGSCGKKTVDLVWIWKQLEGESCTGRSGFIKLAIRILAHSTQLGGCRTCFSVFGLTHTKHRNRLEPQKVHDATTVRMDRQKAHIAAGLTIARKARRFSSG
ncbi:hypothetical protein C8J57DRAFT_1436836 [Mycena rebaudengoi]|nr:hypothetical protein C8J57DRAFT_1436836 [Mycena rebaudengoi]